MNIIFKPIDAKDICQILPLLGKLNTKTPPDILKQRVIEMASYPNYKCIGAFDGEKLIGIAGLWYCTRHYIGRSVEPDHVIIEESYRGSNIGNNFFKWIENHTKSKGYEALELNTYTANRKSHKFYYNQGFEIFGFHFLKIIRGDKNFY